MKMLCIKVFAMSFVGMAYGQIISLDDKGMNPNSIKPIHESRIMYKKEMVRMIDLREKQNQPFFAQGREVSQVIIDAVKDGLIQAWKTDELSEGEKMTREEFLQKLIIPITEETYSQEELDFLESGDNEDNNSIEDSWQNDFFGGNNNDMFNDLSREETVTPQQTFYYQGKDLWQLEIKEERIFDKQRSIMIDDIQAITLIIPSDHPDNIRGIEEAIASFSYKELVEKVFRNNPKAIWYNPYNDKEHKSLADAFELRLFSSYITKVSNPRNETLTDIHGGSPARGLKASLDLEYEMLEFEHNLWSY